MSASEINLFKSSQAGRGSPLVGILSVTLFSININSITKCLPPGIEDYVYVDDFCITSRLKYLWKAENQLQQSYLSTPPLGQDMT